MSTARQDRQARQTRQEKLANVSSLFESVAPECEPRKVAIIRKALAELSRETGVAGKRAYVPFSDAESKASVVGLGKRAWSKWSLIKKDDDECDKVLALRKPTDIRDRVLTLLSAYVKTGEAAGCGEAELEILKEYKHKVKASSEEEGEAKPTEAASSEEEDE